MISIDYFRKYEISYDMLSMYMIYVPHKIDDEQGKYFNPREDYSSIRGSTDQFGC